MSKGKEHIFAPNGGYFVYYPLNTFFAMIYHQIFVTLEDVGSNLNPVFVLDVPSGEERGLLSQTATGNRAHRRCTLSYLLFHIRSSNKLTGGVFLVSLSTLGTSGETVEQHSTALHQRYTRVQYGPAWCLPRFKTSRSKHWVESSGGDHRDLNDSNDCVCRGSVRGEKGTGSES